MTARSDPTAPTALKEAAAQFGLSFTPEQMARFVRYYQDLQEWNQRFNLTRIIAWEDVQIQHLLDSLSCLLVLPDAAQRAPYAVVDVGSGAGFPGLPLKIVLPHIRLTLVESVQKKAAFLQHVVEQLGLTAVEVVAERAEQIGHQADHREAYDLATARAVAALPTLAEYALPLVEIGGYFVAMKGERIEGEVAAAAEAMEILGGRVRTIHPVQLPGLQAPRSLVVVEKVAPTPATYPRRPGMPAKRPLK